MSRAKGETRNPALLAVQAMGSQEKLARAIDKRLTRQAISVWVQKGRIPLTRVPAVSRVTGIPKAELDPAFAE